MFVASLSFYKNLSRLRSRNIANYISPLIPAEAELLDFGCGNCYTILEILEQKPALRITGIDVEEDQNLDHALLAEKKIRFVKNTEDYIAFPDQSFDVAIASSVMHHTSSPEFYLDELKRVVKTGGSIILVEEMYLNFFDRIIISAQDWMFNKLKKGIPVPLHFRSNKHYLTLFREKKLDIVFSGHVRPCPPYIHHYVYQLQVTHA